ncbi:hypothetical protein CMUS01_04656 [Colletotrichum musicola]|uniref:Protein RCR2 n=2 Tax=Colletotrichum orchidearum species complex TaxID=2707337 RepID=A0A8H6KWE1_9PEZI|nr:hypothetical protein CPLU01_13511 [Colletotrichum plurivorum]KAF6838476.1 hypothetical protein CMUS01_04656 [Colletotrichum musicola]
MSDFGDVHILPYPLPDHLEKRQYSCREYYNGRCVERSSWYYWGRWVLAAVVVGIAVLILVVLGCMSSRRRRKRGMNPYYGTGWLSNNQKYHPQQGTYAYNQQYNGQQAGYAGYGQQGGYQNPPPAYGQQQPQYTGTTFNPNDGYYGGHNGGHNEGIQLQQPQNAYQRDGTYSPPAGPPPGK